MQMEEDEKREQEERKRSRDPPIVFKDMVNVQAEYEGLIGALEGKLNDEERTCMDELRLYVLENEGSWALGDNFLNFVGKLLKRYKRFSSLLSFKHTWYKSYTWDDGKISKLEILLESDSKMSKWVFLLPSNFKKKAT